jgi:nucleotide-binding universal stress UspA family protein
MVMTTQGHGIAGLALFGSAADRVGRHADTPTLLVRASAAQVAPRMARIVVPPDALRADDVAVTTAYGHGGLERWLLVRVAGKPVREAAALALLERAKPEERGA